MRLQARNGAHYVGPMGAPTIEQVVDATTIHHDFDPPPFVPETRFGTWFIQTGVWVKYVLSRALVDLKRLAGDRLPSSPVVLDLACGRGRALPLLERELGAKAIIGLDVEPHDIELGRIDLARRVSCPVELKLSDASSIDLPSRSVDVVFCHQSFHHFVDQQRVLGEIKRVLRPGGALLMSESCRSFIYTRRIRYLFRHPMHVQKNAEQYLDVLRRDGFDFSHANYETSFVWWSRRDMGLFERLGIPPRPPAEDTLLNVAAFR